MKTEFDLANAKPLWTIPAERTKNEEPHLVPLSPLAVSIVREAMALSPDSPYLFPAPEGEGPITDHAATRAISRSRSEDERTTTPKPTSRRKGKRKYVPKPGPGLGVKNVRIHDLRRTAASNMADLGVSEHTIGLALKPQERNEGHGDG